MKKIFKTIICLFAFIPFMVNASTGATLSCDKTSLTVGSTTNCTLTANADYEVSGISGNLVLPSGVSLVSIKTNGDFNGDGADGNIALYTEASKAKTGSFNIASFTIKGNAVGKGSVSISNLKYAKDGGLNLASITANTLEITVREVSKDNTLKALSASGITLSPAFSASTTKYTATTDNAETTITATANDGSASVSGSGKIKISYGTKTYKVIVTAESGDQKTYELVITRNDNRSKDNTLKSLAIDGVTLSPAFAANTTKYKASVDSDTMNVTAVANDTKAKVTGTGKIKVSYGTNTYKVIVTAENETKKTYELVITRNDGRDSDNTLKSLSIDNFNLTPTFDPKVNEYSVTVFSDDKSLKIVPVINSTKSKFVDGFGEREIQLTDDIREVLIKVQAENESINEYKIKINRSDKARSSNVNVKTFTIENYDIKYDNNTLSYDVKLNTNDTKLNINVVPEDETTVVNITGNENLKVGSKINVVLTSTDGTTKTITLNMVKSSSMKLIIICAIFGVIVILVIVYFIKKKKGSSISDDMNITYTSGNMNPSENAETNNDINTSNINNGQI